eukprot:1083676-Pelagomonas_calceolata.AAC.2
MNVYLGLCRPRRTFVLSCCGHAGTQGTNKAEQKLPCYQRLHQRGIIGPVLGGHDSGTYWSLFGCTYPRTFDAVLFNANNGATLRQKTGAQAPSGELQFSRPSP